MTGMTEEQRVCEVCFFSAWEPTPEGERCAFCHLEAELRAAKHKMARWEAALSLTDKLPLMREEIDGLKKRVEVERQIADGYARSASLEYRDKLEEEIRTLKEQHDEEMRALYERLRKQGEA